MSDVVCNHSCSYSQCKMQCVCVRVHGSHRISLPHFPLFPCDCSPSFLSTTNLCASFSSFFCCVLLCPFWLCVCCVRLEERGEARERKMAFPLSSFLFPLSSSSFVCVDCALWCRDQRLCFPFWDTLLSSFPFRSHFFFFFFFFFLLCFALLCLLLRLDLSSPFPLSSLSHLPPFHLVPLSNAHNNTAPRPFSRLHTV